MNLTFIISGDGGRPAQRARPCVPSNVKVLLRFRAGALLLRRGLTRGCAVLAIASFLLTGKFCPAQVVESNRPDEPVSAALPQKDSECFGSVVGKIALPGVSASDQKMLSDMLPLHEGDALNRAQIQNSLR